MSAKVYAAAMQLLNEAHYLEFNDSYQTGEECKAIRTDSSTTTITVADTLHPKTITHYKGCEGFARKRELKELESNLDVVMKTRKFTGVSQ